MGTRWKQSAHVASSNAHIATSARLCIELGQNPNKNEKNHTIFRHAALPCISYQMPQVPQLRSGSEKMPLSADQLMRPDLEPRRLGVGKCHCPFIENLLLDGMTQTVYYLL